TIWNELPSPDLPQTDLGRGAITICASDPDRLYVTWANSASSLRGVYRTTDGGVTWTDVSPHEFLWGQGWYNNTIAVSPTDPDLVLAGGGELLRSTDGGATWTGANDPALHADFHACEWSADGTQVWVGHDGGFSHSTDAGLTWSAADNTLPITQFVLVGASPSAEPFVLGGGSQDNGISLTTDGGASWRFGHGGDGGGFSVHPTDPNVIYSTAGLYGGIWTFRRLRTTDGGVNWNHVDGGIGVGSQWWIRVRNDRKDPPTWYSYGDGYVYRTTTGFWFGMNNTATAFPHFVSELTVSRTGGNDGTVYACLDSAADGERLRVWNGTAFEERSSGLPSGFAVRKVPTHPRDPDVAFALMNGIGNPGQKIFRTTDRGQQWTNVTGNLPDVPLADLVAHPTDDQRLFLGTEMGMFATTDGGGTWARWHDGLPEAVVITELTYVDRLAETGAFHLVAGTYGRGIWVRPVAAAATATPLPVAAGPSLRLEAAGPNPFRDGTTLVFSLTRASAVKLRLFDVSGRKVLDVLEGRHPAGPHRVPIDGRTLPAGVYYARLETEAGVATLPVTRLR
ncbi:MAG: T9SS type A sorting domain-containing protein, partial [Gemmatimonadetes bacterium]|nr:T9SS type A sorting domain-containing protein [Gemmatimonadota bacterium]